MRKSTGILFLIAVCFASHLFAKGLLGTMFHIECIMFVCTYFIVKQLEENKSK